MANPPSDYYVDPAIAANSGTGTIGDPYGDLQYALNTITQDITDGDRINIKAGTAEILTAALSLTTYGVTNLAYPLIFQGYTSSQGDGGQGAIDCQTFTVITNSGSGIYWYDLELYDGPSADALVKILKRCCIANCYIHDSDGHGVQLLDTESFAIGNHFEDLGNSTHYMLQITPSSAHAYNNYFKQGALRTCKAAILLDGVGSIVLNNIISVDSSSIGILGDAFAYFIFGNTILSSSGTGKGIDISTHSSGYIANAVINNYVEGFSGTGGIGINMNKSSGGGGVYGKNAVYNNTTNVTKNSEHDLELGDNEVLSVSGLEKSGADTFANRFTYFAPKDTGNMQTGGFPEV